MEERRRFKRNQMKAYCGVYDNKTHKLHGCLVDLSVSGLQLMGIELLTSGSVYKLRIEMHEEINNSRNLLLDAKCVWHKAGSDPDHFLIGFEFSDVDEQTKERITLYTRSTKFVQTKAEPLCDPQKTS